MHLFHRRIGGAVAATMFLAGCVPPPVAPTIPVAPGPNKSFDAFGADQAACQQYAAAQTAPAVAAANTQAVGGALATSAAVAGFGAAIGAAAGNAARGAAIGAATGGAFGITASGIAAASPQVSLQQQFDMVYGQCMAARGNSVTTPPQALERIFPPEIGGSRQADLFG